MKLQYYKESINNNNIDDNYISSASKENNKEKQNSYLIKYRKLYGNSFSDIELLDIFERNNYIDKKIIKDINVLLSIEKDKHLENRLNVLNERFNDKKIDRESLILQIAQISKEEEIKFIKNKTPIKSIKELKKSARNKKDNFGKKS